MTKKETKQITNPHDQFFRKSMEDPRVAADFLKHHLPADIANQVDFTKLELQPRSHSNAARLESTVDVLFKTRIAGKEAYIYLLLEHQSSPDPLMALRVIEYTVHAIREHLRRHKTTKIPLVYPLVVYHGKPYRFKTDINDLVDAPRDLVDQYFLKPFTLVDLNQIDDVVIKQYVWSGVMEFVLKHIFESDMFPFLCDIVPLLKIVDQHGGRDFIGIVLQYVLERAELSDEHTIIELINKNVSYETGEKVMSLAEKLRAEGRLEGKLDEKINLAKKMLQEGVDPMFVAKITELPLNQVKKLQLNQ